MKELAPWLNGIAIALGLWGLFIPSDAVMRMLMIVPPLALALALAFRREVSLEEEVEHGEDDDAPPQRAKAEQRPNLNTMLFAPALALGARAFFDLQFLDWSAPLIAAAAAGVPLTAIAVWSDPAMRAHWGSLAFIAVALYLYAFGALAFANKFYDPAQPQRFQTTVIDQRSKRPVRRTSLENHYVTVTPWGPMQTPDELRVERTLYEQLDAGAPVCVDLYPGRFGWPWYEAKAC
jgi:hypothetical protein